jgi:hypothetical protein
MALLSFLLKDHLLRCWALLQGCRRWNVEEEQALVEYVQRYPGQWKLIERLDSQREHPKLGGRTNVGVPSVWHVVQDCWPAALRAQAGQGSSA